MAFSLFYLYIIVYKYLKCSYIYKTFTPPVFIQNYMQTEESYFSNKNEKNVIIVNSVCPYSSDCLCMGPRFKLFLRVRNIFF